MVVNKNQHEKKPSNNILTGCCCFNFSVHSSNSFEISLLDLPDSVQNLTNYHNIKKPKKKTTTTTRQYKTKNKGK